MTDTDRLNLLESLCRQSEVVWLFNGYGSDLILAEYTGRGDGPDTEELSKAPSLREAIDRLPKSVQQKAPGD